MYGKFISKWNLVKSIGEFNKYESDLLLSSRGRFIFNLQMIFHFYCSAIPWYAEFS